MRKLATVVFALFIMNASQAQGVERPMGTSANASQIYVELFGPGIFYSINYDGRFGKYENGFGMRAGLSGAGDGSGGYFAVPVQFNYLLGNNGQYLELGAGATFVSAAIDLWDNTSSTNHVAGTATIAFRKQPFGKKGITWRLAFSPFIVGGGFIPWGGFSVGYRF